MNAIFKRLSVLLIVTVCSTAGSFRQANARLRGPDPRAVAVFDLAVKKSDVLKLGTSSIVAESAYLTLAHGLNPGNSDGLEIMFFTGPFTEAARADVLNNDAKELKKSNYAALVLFLDKQSKVWQVNLSYVVPGTTVGQTVAWKRDDIEKYFSDLQFDGKQLVLRSKGSYSESESGQETMRLSWNVDINLPVIREVKR
jgi:hypothetical protein